MNHSTPQLSELFRRAGATRGDTVFVHSSLFHIGPLEPIAIPDMPRVLYDALATTVGPEGTIAAPTFTFSFCDGATFHRQHSPSEKMGALAEYIRQRPRAIRSPHPIQSIAACGANAAVLTNRWSPDAFRPGSPFDALVQANALLLFIGCDIEAASLIHWAESRVKVPYRYWKRFHGTCISGEDARRRTVEMFVRRRDWASEVRCAPVGQALRDHDQLRQFQLGRGHLLACRAQPFVHHAMRLLMRDPLCLIAEAPTPTGERP